jgi:hypothetical protein
MVIQMSQIFAGAGDSKISVYGVYKILDADYLLAPYKTLLAPIKDNKLMMELLVNFVEFVQVFPDTPTGKMGELLDKSIQRALYILEVYRNDPKFAKTYDPVWELVFFSVALLQDITKIMDYGVIICEQDGTYKKLWHPCSEGPMTKVKGAKYYRVLPLV